MKKLVLITMIGFTGQALACISTGKDGKDGIFPKNNAYIPATKNRLMTIKEDSFKRAIAKYTALYKSAFEKQGRTLEIRGDWNDGTVNAYANREGSVSVVQMFGGLARHKLVTDDAFEMVICHELGHHIGGAPKKGVSWASNEGQSDYFATLKCAREAWKNEDNISIAKTLGAPTLVTAACSKTFADPSESALCVRSAMAGKSLADTLADLGKSPETQFDQPDTKKVTSTNHNHPKAQCRLDTYFAGAVCEVSKDAALDDKDPTAGTCSMEKGAKFGVRPLCWYAVGGNTEPTPTPEGGW